VDAREKQPVDYLRKIYPNFAFVSSKKPRYIAKCYWLWIEFIIFLFIWHTYSFTVPNFSDSVTYWLYFWTVLKKDKGDSIL